MSKKNVFNLKVKMTADASKYVYERQIYVDSLLLVDFSSLVTSMQFLYGNCCVVLFECQELQNM